MLLTKKCDCEFYIMISALDYEDLNALFSDIKGFVKFDIGCVNL
jgi:hypothetical protein